MKSDITKIDLNIEEKKYNQDIKTVNEFFKKYKKSNKFKRRERYNINKKKHK